MIKENIVSLWLGNFESEDMFMEYITEEYTEDGDGIASEFCKEFFEGDEPYEHDLLECFITTRSRDISVLLEGCSYDESVIKSLSEALGGCVDEEYNAVILIYDFEMDGIPLKSDMKVKYIASVPYEKI